MSNQDAKHFVTHEIIIPTLSGDGIAERIEIKVPCELCPYTNETLLGYEALTMIEAAKARHLGLLRPIEIKALRDRLGLTQKELSDLLQIGAKTYTLWETGKSRPSRSMNVLLRALKDGKLDLTYLRSIQKPAPTIWGSVVPMNSGLMWEAPPNPKEADDAQQSAA